MSTVIKVNKEDFEIECSMSGVYSIEGYINDELMTVWGGDSACEDHQDEELVNHIYNEWDGKLRQTEDWIGHEEEYRIDV